MASNGFQPNQNPFNPQMNPNFQQRQPFPQPGGYDAESDMDHYQNMNSSTTRSVVRLHFSCVTQRTDHIFRLAGAPAFYDGSSGASPTVSLCGATVLILCRRPQQPQL